MAADEEPAVTSQPAAAASNRSHAATDRPEAHQPEPSTLHNHPSASLESALGKHAASEPAQLGREALTAGIRHRAQPSTAAAALAAPASGVEETGHDDVSGYGNSGMLEEGDAGEQQEGTNVEGDGAAASWKREAAAQPCRSGAVDAPLLLQCTEEVGREVSAVMSNLYLLL